MEARTQWSDERLEDRFDLIERRFDRVERRLDWLIAMVVGVLIAVIKGGLG